LAVRLLLKPRVTDHARRNCEQRGAEREARRAGDREARERDVPGHVGHEGPAQPQDADGIDQAGDRGQGQQQRRQRAVPGIAEQRPGGAVCGELRTAAAMRCSLALLFAKLNDQFL
jgi:hypothetical protein